MSTVWFLNSAQVVKKKKKKYTLKRCFHTDLKIWTKSAIHYSQGFIYINRLILLVGTVTHFTDGETAVTHPRSYSWDSKSQESVASLPGIFLITRL